MVFVIWSGWGFLTLLIIPVVGAVVAGLLVAAFQAAGFVQFEFLAISIGALTAAFVNWVVGRRLNGRPPRELIDAKTGERVFLTRRHTLFWIRMEYWSIPVAILGLTPLLALKTRLVGQA